MTNKRTTVSKEAYNKLLALTPNQRQVIADKLGRPLNDIHKAINSKTRLLTQIHFIKACQFVMKVNSLEWYIDAERITQPYECE